MKSIHPDNKLNNLPGDRWLYLTQSVMKTNYSRSCGFALRQKHGANKPPELMKELVEFFTKRGATVLDPFAGVGGTLLGAAMCGRKSIGIELNSKWISIYRKVCRQEGVTEQPIHKGDCLKVMDDLVSQRRKFSLILTDPPYNIRFDRTMCHGKYLNRNRHTDFGRFSRLTLDFANSRTYAEYLLRISLFLERSYQLLHDGRYLVLITKNAYQNGQYLPVSQDIAGLAQKCGFLMKGEIVWYNNGVRLRPYGYPFSYVPNIIHHNILIFRKSKTP